MAWFFALPFEGGLRGPLRAEGLAAGVGGRVNLVLQFLAVFHRAPDVERAGGVADQLVSGQDGRVGPFAVPALPAHLIIKGRKERWERSSMTWEIFRKVIRI